MPGIGNAIWIGRRGGGNIPDVTPSDGIITEDDSYILTENNEYLIQE